MNTDKSGAGYGNHGDDGSMGGQDGEKSKDYEQGKEIGGIDPGGGEDAPKPGFDKPQ